MYDLRPATKSRPWMAILLALGALVSLPVVYIGLLIVGAFLKGFLGF